MQTGALSDYRVVEIGSGVSAAYAAKLFADLGADVIKVEPPEGDETRWFGPFPGNVPDPEVSGLFLYLNSNKRGVALDLDVAADRQSLDTLLEHADLVIHNLAPRTLRSRQLDPESILRGRPRMVAASISPFGLSGPNSGFRAYDLNLWNAGGIAYLNGAGPGSEHLPPLRAFGHQASFQTGLNAAIASLAALLSRDRDGHGQHVEVSAQECLVAILELTYPYWPYCGLVASRLGAKPIQPLDFFECKDGWIFLCAVEEHQWRSFVDFMGSPEWAELEIFADRLQRGANWDALKLLIAEWMAEQTVEELYQALQRRRVPLAPVSTMGDLLSSAHLKQRGFFVTFEGPNGKRYRAPGAPYHFSQTPWQLRRPAPKLGEHTPQIFAELDAGRGRT